MNEPFEVGMQSSKLGMRHESLTNEDLSRPETVVDNEVSRAVVEKKFQAILLEIMHKN